MRRAAETSLRTILRLAQERDTLQVIDDQIGGPTGAELIADVTAHLISTVRTDRTHRRAYHLATAGETSWYGYACFIVERAPAFGWPLRLTSDSIEPISSEQLSTPARRPRNSRLNCHRLVNTFGLRLPPWRIGVEKVLAETASFGAPDISDVA